MIAETPPMGWNSWDCFGVSVTEEEVRANAEFMSARLKDFGWQYIVVDLGWYAPDANKDNYKQPGIHQLIDEFGRLVPCPRKFPSSAGGQGFRPLAEYVHSLGLKFGIHIMRGIPWQATAQDTPILNCDQRAASIAAPHDVCFWFKGMHGVDMCQPGGQAYYDSLLRLYAEWGVDYIKADDINSWDGEGRNEPYHTDEIEGLATAIQRCGRPIVLSLSPGAALPCNANHLRKHANLWRISADFWDDWTALKRQFPRCAYWARHAAPGHWPDPDMLPIGRIGIRGEVGVPRSTNFTEDEQYTLLTLWLICRAPLMFGGHLPDSDPLSLAQITNPEALAVNQASSDNREVFRSEEEACWSAVDPSTGDLYLAMFNLSDAQRTLRYDFPDGAVRVRDLWARQDLREAHSCFEIALSPHGAGLYRLTKKS